MDRRAFIGAVATGMIAVPLAAKVSVLDPVVLGGLKAAVTPPGNPDADKLTLPLKPFCELTAIVLLPLPPCATVTLAGEDESAKSGVAPQLFILKLTTRVCQLKLPFAGMYSVVNQNVQSSAGSTVMAA